MPDSATELPLQDRLVSLDALRGFDMFWIIGGDVLGRALRDLADWPIFQFAARQLEHVEWHGMVFYDLIFPLFVFVMGVSIPLAFTKRLARGESRATLYGHLVRRAIILFALGVFFNGGLTKPWPDVRIAGVLQRIALCYLFGGIIYLNFKPRGQALGLAFCLVLYWALMALVPVPGYGAGHYTPEGNLAAYLDRLYLPGRKYFGNWDPEGYLSTIPAVGTALVGILSGQLLLGRSVSGRGKAAILFVAGLAGVLVGWLWDQSFPVNKKIWTSSFVLVAGGYSCLLLGAFYLVIDVWKFRRWAFPLVVIGMNAITIYIGVEIIGFADVAGRLAGGDIAPMFGSGSKLVLALLQLALEWGVLYFLYRRRIFLRI